MKKDIIQLSKVIVLGVLLSGVIAYASTWTAPTGTFPGSNTEGPINVGTTYQYKGNLAQPNFLSSLLRIYGGLSSNTLAVFGDATVTGAVTLGTTTNPSAVTQINGDTTVGNAPPKTRSLTVNGPIRSSFLTNANPTSIQTVCANSVGELIVCPNQLPRTYGGSFYEQFNGLTWSCLGGGGNAPDGGKNPMTGTCGCPSGFTVITGPVSFMEGNAQGGILQKFTDCYK